MPLTNPNTDATMTSGDHAAVARRLASEALSFAYHDVATSPEETMAVVQAVNGLTHAVLALAAKP
jgi:hypothetical protein